MRVSGITNTTKYQTASTRNINNQQVTYPTIGTLERDTLQKKSNNISFRGAPWRLNLSAIGVPEYGAVTAEQAIRAFKELRLGNYLDIGDDRFNYYANNAIRKDNLSFLDRVIDTNEKREFIIYYQNFTGFPYLKTVSKNIEEAFVDAVVKSARNLNMTSYGRKYEVVQAGYDGVCSVGRGKALPGSDLDKAYIILKGGEDSEAEEIVNNFRGQLWNNTDQRILSYNHDEAAFPQVYTQGQIIGLVKAADKAAYQEFLAPTWKDLIPNIIPKYPLIRRYTTMRGFKNVKKEFNPDYVKANEFYIKICQRFPKRNSDRIDLANPSRENIKNVGFVLEAMREGEIFRRFGSINSDRVKGGISYNLVNLSQLEALRQHGDKKPKRLSRDNIKEEFFSWDTDKQFRFIKTLIEGSCGNNTDFTTEFSKYFSKSGDDPFKPLIDALMN